MQTVICAMFGAPSEAELALAELVACGGMAHDLTVLALRTEENPAPDFEDGRLHAVEDEIAIERPLGANPPPTNTPSAEELPTLVTPYGEVPGGPVVLLDVNHPGDLIGRLKSMGFGEAISRTLEDVVMSGGALLIGHMPSGLIDDCRAWQVIEALGGSGVAKSGPYVA